MSIPIFTKNNPPNFKNCALAYGHFNSVHPGHIRYLKNAASHGEKLIVAILPDTNNGVKSSYKFTQKERAEGLSAITIIDGIYILSDEEYALCDAINFLNPSYLVLGTEFEDSKNPRITKAINKMKKKRKESNFSCW